MIRLCSLIGYGHVIAGNPSSPRIVIAIVRLGPQIAIFLQFAISLSKYRKFAIVWQAPKLWNSGTLIGKVEKGCVFLLLVVKPMSSSSSNVT